MKKENTKQASEGITLIALMITVIVMLILAGIAINLTIGDNGIFKKSDEGAQIYINAANNEASSLNDVDSKMGDLINQYHGGNDLKTVEDAKGEKFEETTTIKDKNDEKVPIPGGFIVSPDSSDDVNNGVVVVDGEGNEFVWVPVPDPTTMYIEENVTLTGGYSTTSRYSKLRTRSEDSNYTITKPGDTVGIREPDFTTIGAGNTNTISQLIKDILGTTESDNNVIMKAFSDSLVEEYNAMIDSVIKYKGFYIGRYELTGTIDKPTSKRGVVLTNQNWYSLKKACNNVINNKFVKSCMIYGCQWDETMNWLVRSGAKTEEEINVDSGSWGKYQSTTDIEYNEAWKVNNIYDLAGNYYEWTQEASQEVRRVLRGGNYYFPSSTAPATSRLSSDSSLNDYDSSCSSRPTLILK